MSNNLINFLNSKNEVNLSAERIELTIVGDMDKELKVALKELSSIETFKSKARQPLDDAKSANRQAGISANNVIKMYDSFASQAKELGIDVPANVKDIKTRAEKIITEFKESQAKLISITSQL